MTETCMAAFSLIRQQFSDAIIVTGANPPRVAFTYKGRKCIADIDSFKVKVTIMLCGGYFVIGHVPYVCRALDMQRFMARMAQLEKDANDKAGIIQRMASFAP